MSKLKRTTIISVLFLMLGVGSAPSAHALIIDVTINGSDAIFLAGRIDLVIPPANQSWPGGMLRHSGPTPEEILETLPPIIAVSAGDVIRALDPAVGGISFFNGFGAPLFGPDGGVGGQTNLSGFGGISGFLSDGQGPLAGVFLDNSIPNGVAPARLDFTAGGIGTDFLALTPGLGEAFFIGDGQTSGGIFHEFTAPAGATRLALGIPDGFGFVGVPGAYDDNDGAYRIRIGINEVPTIPEPTTIMLMGLGLAGIGFARRRLNV
jgi:hypothetical protein